MHHLPIVKLHRGGKKVEQKFHAHGKTNFKKNDKVSAAATRTLFQHYATIDAILRLLGLKECEGDLTIDIRDGTVDIVGEIRTYHEVAFFAVGELVSELVFTAHCLATQFRPGSVTGTISFVQSLEYKSS